MVQSKKATARDRGTLLLGSSILTLWVLFRFSTKSINFDLIGQQLLARQWLDGNFEGSTIGPTNYIVKILFLYMPGELLGIDPKIFLIVSTVLVNIVTFIGLYSVLKKILQYFSVKAGDMFNISMLWLACVAGSVFWVQYTNSRNIELLAGLVLLYVGLLFYREMTPFRAISFFLLGGVTYFSDPLQLFVTSSILVLYVFIHGFFIEKTKRKEPCLLLGLIVAGFLLSRFLLIAANHFTSIEIISMNTLSMSLAILEDIPVVVVETAKNILRLIAGTNEMGVWRQILNITFAGLLTALSFISLVKNERYKKQQSFVLFVALLLTVPVAVYAASGQAVFKGDTSRYMIMLAPALIMLFSTIDLTALSVRTKQLAAFVIVVVLVANSGSLAWATLSREGVVLSTSHLEARYLYLEEKNYHYGYASMDTSLSAMYLLGRDSGRALLPLSCDGITLRKSTLFYDKHVFTKNEQQGGRVPIILDGDAISNYPNNCTIELIKAQIGEPILVDGADGSTVLVYDSSQLKGLEF